MKTQGSASAINFYERLGVASSATTAEIHTAYRARMSQYHPDHNNSRDAGAVAVLINEAWETLGDAERRHQYDANGSITEDARQQTHSQPVDGSRTSSASRPVDPRNAPTIVDWVRWTWRIDPGPLSVKPDAARRAGAVILLAIVDWAWWMWWRDSRGYWYFPVRLVFLHLIVCWTLLKVAVARCKRRSTDGHEPWVCPECGRHVPSYVGTCRCGLKRPHTDGSAGNADMNDLT